jgi:L-lactate dehydrogenase complex protein LldG
MSSKEDILANIRKNTRRSSDMPDLSKADGIHFPDTVAHFMEVSKAVGGDVYVMKDGEDVNNVIRTLYPDAQRIASNVEGVSIATVNPDKVDSPQSLNDTDVTVVRGMLGVAENGCVWIPQQTREKAAYFIAEYLVILLKHDAVVDNMHEAYREITFNDYGFGTFISGPSKTADIEQALVKGAQSARGVTVILCP